MVQDQVGVIFLTSFSADVLADEDEFEIKWHELNTHLPKDFLETRQSLSMNWFYLVDASSPRMWVVPSNKIGIYTKKKLNLNGFSRCKTLNASSIYKYEGLLWLLMYTTKPGCGLFYTAFHDSALHMVQATWKEDVITVSAAPEALWVLTNLGRIFIRTEMSNTSEGQSWKELDLIQLTKDNIRLIDLSLSSDAAWAVDEQGTVWMRLGPLQPPTSDCLPVWIQVDGGATPRGSETINSQICFIKVYTSASGRIVWAVDREHNVYVRQGIFSDFRQGVDWLLVPGITAIALAVSDVTVWALSSSGTIFERVGISENNFVGDTWRRLQNLKGSCISSSVCNELYVLDMEGEIIRVTSSFLSLAPDTDKDQLTSRNVPDEGLEDDDWSVVNSGLKN